MPMKSEKKDKVVLDHETQKNRSKLPKNVDQGTRLSVANTRLFCVALVMGLISLFSIYAQHEASIRADNSIKVAWVKMYPNGSWDVDFHDDSRSVNFTQATIDTLLKNWVIRRYSKVPSSVNSDYGYVYEFMSDELRNDFVSSEGFDAPKKAAEIEGCNNCLRIKVPRKSLSLDHYDSDKTKFGTHEGTLYRSNVFATLETIGSDGIRNGEPKKVIISLHWRIRSVEEIQADKKSLDHNPIGLEILDYSLLLNKTQNTKKEGGQS